MILGLTTFLVGDTMPAMLDIAVVPILLGRGERLWDGLEGLEKEYAIEATSSPSGVTHLTFTRAGENQRAANPR